MLTRDTYARCSVDRCGVPEDALDFAVESAALGRQATCRAQAPGYPPRSDVWRLGT